MFFFCISEDPVTVAVPLSLPEVQTLLVSLRNVAAHPNFRAFIQVGILSFPFLHHLAIFCCFSYVHLFVFIGTYSQDVKIYFSFLKNKSVYVMSIQVWRIELILIVSV